ncbi:MULTISPECIES: fimbrial protein [unclassified Aureimonas]|uniref:fimbrial protein n=1 Tax=unclassified Aureimonas TaxID=2615206 RepID=UPI000A644E61|nr:MULTISPECIES: fimbrial protein [unclassified Aureimonas]
MTEIGDDAAEKPLDPATERLRRKMVRLLALSVSTLFIGVMAVLGAIVYKLNRDAPPSGTEAADLAIALPAGSILLDMATSGDTALLRLAPNDGAPASLLRIDLATGAVIARYRLDGLAQSPASPESPAPAPRPAPATTGSGAPTPMLDLYKTP